MIAASVEMMSDIRESLREASLKPGALIPLKTMARHFCSLMDTRDNAAFLQLMTLDVDGQRVFIYFKV